PGLDPDFIALINRAMARDLERRYGSARELAEALKQWCQRPRLAGTDSSGAFNVDGAAAQVGLFGAARERSSVSALEVPGELGAASRGRRTAPLVAAGRTVPTPGPFSGTSPDVTAFPGEPTARGRQARLAALLCVVAAFVGL